MMSTLPTAGRTASLIASLLTALLLSACGSDGVGDGNTLAFLTITDSRGVQPTGSVETFQCLPGQLFLVGTFDDGSRDTTLGRRTDAVWSSSDESLVRVSNGEIVIDDITHPKGTLIPSALLAAVGQTVTISVSFLGLTASQTVVVRPGTLKITPTGQTIAKGTELVLFATAIFGQDDVTDSVGTNLAADFGTFVDWTSSDDSIATVDANGVVRGIGAGEADITAKTGVSCPTPADLTTQITVQDVALTDFDFIPAITEFSFADIGLATGAFVRLIGNFAGGLKQDLTFQAGLDSDDATVVAETSNIITSTGSAANAGSTDLTASFDLDGDGPGTAVTEQQPVVVDGVKQLDANGLNISPAGPLSMFQGTTLELDALGAYDDGSTQNLYRNVFWSSSDTTIAGVSAVGIVTASDSTTGTSTITASRNDPVSSQLFSPTVAVTVVDSLASMTLDISCPDPIFLANITGDCRAVASLPGGMTQDVSLSAIWSFDSNPGVAEVSNVRLNFVRRNDHGTTTPLPGRVYALADGSAVIRASLFDESGTRLATGTDTVNVSSAPPPPPDSDGDGVPDASDNCPNTANAGQENNDGDSQGDACDPDDDNDGVVDGTDNCPLVANPDQTNTDGDAQGDACDDDDDNDGVVDAQDECAATPNGAVVNAAGCPDTDGDGVFDNEDMCPAEDARPNPSNSRTGCLCNNPNPLPIPPACLE